MSELTNKIYEYFDRNDEPRVYKHWHVSDIAKCPREQYFLRLGIPPVTEVGAGKKIRWRLGHIFEDMAREALKESHPDLKSNLRATNKELDLTGEFDILIDDTLVSIKTTHPWADRYLQKDPQPYLAHEFQEHGYKILFPDAKKMAWVYYPLGGLLHEFHKEENPEITRNIYKRLDVLNRAWATKTPPPCICRETEHPLYKSQMQYCGYQTANDCCSLELLNKEANEKRVE